MKRLTLILCGVLLWISSSFAQRYPYELELGYTFVADTVVLSDCTYVVDHMDNFEVRIYNIANHPGREHETWEDGTIVNMDADDPVEEMLDHRLRLDKIIEETLGDEYLHLIGIDKGGEVVYITLNISSQSGAITDVYFSYMARNIYGEPSKLVQIPIEKYREIELRTKQELAFTLTEVGRNMSHISLFCDYKGNKTESTNNIVTDVPALELPNSNLRTEH